MHGEVIVSSRAFYHRPKKTDFNEGRKRLGRILKAREEIRVGLEGERLENSLYSCMIFHSNKGNISVWYVL